MANVFDDFRDGLTARLDAMLAHDDEQTPPNARPRRVPLSELGEDFFVPVVSLVKKGQAPKAKIVALKAEQQEQEAGTQDPSQGRFWLAAVRAMLDQATAEDQAILADLMERLEGQQEQAAEPEAAQVAAKSSRTEQRRDTSGRRLDDPLGLKRGANDDTRPRRDSRGRRRDDPLGLKSRR